MPTASVGKPTGVKVKYRNTSEQDVSFGAVDASANSGDASAEAGTCSGVLPPGGECEMTYQHIAYEPGPYTGELTVETSLETFTVPLSGEAVAAEPTETENPPTETTESPPTETTEPEPTEPAETEPTESESGLT
ncbi:hypothetical protein ACFWUQ_22575 [Streptomyces sp. NPDC058662]|uniref:hypothetical protein n=1 Tax=Streptomyces sp. NPDC058662 TaxID=3346583 RepID=UPI00365CC361